jgi:hypothetical protein
MGAPNRRLPDLFASIAALSISKATACPNLNALSSEICRLRQLINSKSAAVDLTSTLAIVGSADLFEPS